MAFKVPKLSNVSPFHSVLHVFESFSLSHTHLHTSPFFSVLVTQHISCGILIVPDPGGKAHFADTAADVLYSTAISVRPALFYCQARGRDLRTVYAQILDQIAKCTLEHFFICARIDLAQIISCYCCCAFYWPSLNPHRQMNHKQNHVVKMIGLLLQNRILCYPDLACLLAYMHQQNM